jgi:peptide/nickel transport system permease protein
MGEIEVRLRHVLRHALQPGITLTGWSLGYLFSGTVIIEGLFTRQGLGQTLVNAVAAQDMPVTGGIVLLVTVVYIVANLLIDTAYQVIDPRLRNR